MCSEALELNPDLRYCFTPGYFCSVHNGIFGLCVFVIYLRHRPAAVYCAVSCCNGETIPELFVILSTRVCMCVCVCLSVGILSASMRNLCITGYIENDY